MSCKSGERRPAWGFMVGRRRGWLESSCVQARDRVHWLSHQHQRREQPYFLSSLSRNEAEGEEERVIKHQKWSHSPYYTALLTTFYISLWDRSVIQILCVSKSPSSNTWEARGIRTQVISCCLRGKRSLWIHSIIIKIITPFPGTWHFQIVSKAVWTGLSIFCLENQL